MSTYAKESFLLFAGSGRAGDGLKLLEADRIRANYVLFIVHMKLPTFRWSPPELSHTVVSTVNGSVTSDHELLLTASHLILYCS